MAERKRVEARFRNPTLSTHLDQLNEHAKDLAKQPMDALRAPTKNSELENSLEKYFREKVRRILGGAVYKLISTGAGVPDRMVLLPGGRILLVELKTVKGEPSALQEIWHLKAARLGTIVHVISGKEEIDRWIEAQH